MIKIDAEKLKSVMKNYSDKIKNPISALTCKQFEIFLTGWIIEQEKKQLRRLK